MTNRAIQSLDKLDKLGKEGVIEDLKRRGGTRAEVWELELYMWAAEGDFYKRIMQINAYLRKIAND